MSHTLLYQEHQKAGGTAVELTKELVRELFDYQSDGSLVWKTDLGGWRKKGRPAGTVDGCGYVHIGINGKRVKAHRVSYLWHHGELPSQIDHINGNRRDNRIENLRAATNAENVRNAKKRRGTSSQFKGVVWSPKYRKWIAQIVVPERGPRLVYLGIYANETDAARAYDRAALQHFGEFARPNFPAGAQ